MSRSDKPFRLCGCLYFDTEAEAVAVQAFLREVLHGGGFSVESQEKRSDGALVTRTVSA